MNETSHVTSDGRERKRAERARVRPLEHDHTGIAAQLRVELAVADVDRDDARGAALEQAVREAARRRADVEAVRAGHVEAEGVERVRELLAAAGDERRRPLDLELGVLVDLLAGLRVPRDEPGQDEGLRLGTRLGEAALDEQHVEALLHRGSSTSRSATAARRQSSYVL